MDTIHQCHLNQEYRKKRDTERKKKTHDTPTPSHEYETIDLIFLITNLHFHVSEAIYALSEEKIETILPVFVLWRWHS